MARHVHIVAGQSRPELGLREVWRYRDLVLLLAERSLKVSYKQTLLGPAWLFVQPLASSAVYAVVFGEIARIGTEGVPTYLFYLLGTAIWGVFSSCVGSTSNVFNWNAGLFGKVYFPRMVAPIASVLTALLRFAIALVPVVAYLAWCVVQGLVTPRWGLLWALPLVVAHLAVLGLSVGLVASSLTITYRDLGFAVGPGVRLLMYATPVVYPLSQVGPGVLRTVISWNPVTPMVELFRLATCGVGTVEAGPLVASAAFAIVLFVASAVLFNRVEKTFVDRV